MSEKPPAADSTHEATSPMTAGSGSVSGFAARDRNDGFAEGNRLGEFELIKRLGQGGMASVWLAEQTSLHRNVALKLLRPDLMADETYVKRFQTEAKAAAGLNHPNIVQVYIIGESEGQHFIAQEYVQGQTLKSYLQKKGAVDLTLGLHIMRQVAAALQAAGDRGIVHRDIKPENIMLTKKGEAKVADFGLAQLSLNGEKLNLTQEGVTMGTPLYMSPEQVNGKKLDARSDLYSFGVSCYHMFGGRPPFQGETAVSVAVQHLQNQPAPLRELRPDLPQPVCDLIARLMSKQPDDRYPDAATLLEDVRKLLKIAKENGRLDQVKLAEIGGPRVPQSYAGRHPVIALTLLCLLAGGLSAAAGWAMRPADPLLTQPGQALSFGVDTKASAAEQFKAAMFQGRNEDDFLAVLHLHDHSPSSEEWKARAHEQLALLYLRHRERWPDAAKELSQLQNVTTPAREEFAAKAHAGEVILAAYQHDSARGLDLFNSSLSQFRKFGLYPGGDETAVSGGTWRRLLVDARRLLGAGPPEGP
ncbi:MAG: protein kinase domain-containing protein [Planctomycetaceae bacterium]